MIIVQTEHYFIGRGPIDSANVASIPPPTNLYLNQPTVAVHLLIQIKFDNNFYHILNEVMNKSEYPWCIIRFKSKHFPTVFKKIEKNKKTNDGKTGIFTQNQFSTEIFTKILCTCYLYTVKFSKIFDSNFYEIYRKRENLQRNDNDLSSNDFNYFISRRYLKFLPVPHKLFNKICFISHLYLHNLKNYCFLMLWLTAIRKSNMLLISLFLISAHRCFVVCFDNGVYFVHLWNFLS
ncbi:Uncharacterized protein FWK35_00005024 [Aphis craccivora]|uniref:Uncharacterized protein n=1 Tax=Aphis craccivora TaxID=307492 RepID=A0A6G0Z0I5_APHCR|nr:Uncharacterized protein FWK35_00005024 [Aphis craccivora]